MKQCSDPACQKSVREDDLNTLKVRLGNEELFFCDHFCKDQWYRQAIGLHLPPGLQVG